jgi:large subunit ribosomal protein L15
MSILMECAQWITGSAPKRGALVQDRFGREPFAHRSLEMLDNLNVMQPLNIVTRERVQRLALDVGLDKVLRWKPKTVRGRKGRRTVVGEGDGGRRRGRQLAD